MKELAADLWSLDALVCITTNGTVKRNGENIMGGGCAREAADRYPWMPLAYGQMLDEFGVHTMPLGPLIMFPTKWTIDQPADIELVIQSAEELIVLADLYGWESVALPQPGCGLGGLDWYDVKWELWPILDDRITVVSYPGGK